MKKVVILTLMLTLVAPAVFAQAKQKALELKRVQPNMEDATIDRFHQLESDLQNRILEMERQETLRRGDSYRVQRAGIDLRDLGDLSPADLEGAYTVITELNRLRHAFIVAKKNDRELLKKVIGFYDSLSANLSSNSTEASLGNFTAQNEALVARVCKLANEPINAGWGEKVYLANYAEEGQEWVRQWLMAEENGIKLAALSRVLTETDSETPAVKKVISVYKPTVEESKSIGDVLGTLVQIRTHLASQKEEDALYNLQVFGSLYRTIAQHFAANGDTASRFQAKNPALIKELAKEIQRPMKVGWKEGETIVMGYYIAEHLPEAYNAWYASDAATELDTFNRDILVGAAK